VDILILVKFNLFLRVNIKLSCTQKAYKKAWTKYKMDKIYWQQIGEK